MLPFLRNVLDPPRYHGRWWRPPFFEGWYYKLVDASERHRYAVIPGVFLGQQEAKNHAFVQVLDGATGAVTYHRYPLSEFWSAEDHFDIRVGPNRFTKEGIALDIHGPQRQVCGEIALEGIVPWPVTLASPGIMGWYAWVPLMECYHGVVSLDHGLQGVLEVDGQRIDFGGGRGYTEKDWGRSFPSAWVWFQSNHFDRPGTSLTASVAIIPWIGSAFAGFIIGLWHGGRLLRFATYTGARIERLVISDHEIRWAVRDRHHRLEMVAGRAEGGLLRAPAAVDMDRRVAETLNATVDMRLVALRGGHEECVYTGRGRHGGLEAVGDLQRLAAMRGAAISS